ncbi:MAG TPA: polysaccharide deacetylase family protein [Chryseosolibacter sp.]|nr:polysaccharide deacetylase family protein [Chryseosolibacter sp.]
MKILAYIVLTLFLNRAIAQEIAITFDDAPTPQSKIYDGNTRTSRIIEQLKTSNVDQVAFFVITKQIDDDGADRLRAYTDAGHLIANHTHTHQWIHRQGCKNYLDGITEAHNRLDKMAGYTPFFRYPFLDEGRTRPVRDSIRNHLGALGLKNGYVTIDNYDWYINTLVNRAKADSLNVDYDKLRDFYIEHIWNSIQFYDAIARKTIGRSPKHVLLLHENDLAAMFINDLIDFIRKQNWKIISPTEAYTDPIADIIPDVLFNGQGRIGAIAFSKGVPAKELVQESEDEEWLEREMKIRNIITAHR